MLPLLAGTVCLDGSPPEPALADRLAAAVRNQSPVRQRQLGFAAGWFSAGLPVARPGRLTRRWAGDDDTRDWVLAFDGRLVEREALIEELDLADAGPRPDDAGLALAAFARWGDGAAGHLRGRFAVALWQGNRRRLVLALDPVGEASLFYHCDGRRVIFGNTLRLLRALPQVPGDLDEETLSLFLSDTLGGPERTFYRAIARLTPATTLAFDRQGRTAWRHWQIDWSRRLRLRSDADYVEAGREVLDRAVARVLPASGPVVSMLSGGLDSGAVTATAARLAGPRGVTALTAVPPDGASFTVSDRRFGDERAHAGLVAQMHPTVRHEVHPAITPHPMEAEPERFFAMLNVPWRNVHNIGWLVPLHDRAAALGAEALLVGAAGNVGFSFDGTDGLLEMALTGDLRRMLREARALARRRRDVTAAGLVRTYVLRGLLPAGWQARTDRWRGRTHAWTGAVPLRPEIWDGLDIAGRWVAQGRGYRQGRNMRRFWLERMLNRAGDLRPALEHLSGIHLRDPLVDIDLLAFFFSLPPEQFLRDGMTRSIARRIVADRLPAQVAQETRRGRQSPEWFHRINQYRDRITAEVAAMPGSPLARRLLDVPRLQALVERWPEDGEAAYSDYGAALTRGVYMSRFLRWVEARND